MLKTQSNLVSKNEDNTHALITQRWGNNSENIGKIQIITYIVS
ncbi:hypothetical protein HMPREF1567_0046 [Providencia alcalifaciens PAL-2]|nr:hypothetical protein HMPREF1562_3549 [Providencia alcalifaciens F90-2004]EUC95513.1 hypothetical protein HMPREF1567_0046 [Providencia alcalifaciens PAL-2]